MKKIESLTPEQELLIPQIRQKWIDNASTPIDFEKAKDVLLEIYSLAGKPHPLHIVYLQSPAEALMLICLLKSQKVDSLGDSLWAPLGTSLGASLGDSLRDSLWDSLGDSLRDSLWDSLGDSLRDSLWASLWASLRDSLGDSLRDSLWDSLGDSLRASLWASLGDSLWDSLGDSLGDSLRDSLGGSLRGSLYPEWMQAWGGFFEMGKMIGAKHDQSKYDLYMKYCQYCGWVFPYENLLLICDRPQVQWDDEGRIHSETQPAIFFKSGWSVWAINGVRVDEQIVLRPETQTLEQINQEKNEEVKRIRITRYGWINYLREVRASVLDTVQAPGGWMEALIQTKDFKVLCTYDPSTGRPYALEVSKECNTCEQAQNYLAGFSDGAALEGLGVSVQSSYPVVRT